MTASLHAAEPSTPSTGLLRRIIPRGLGCVRYVDHVVGRGIDLFRLACEQDLEGIVAKLARSAYRTAGDRRPWLKIK